MEKSLAYIKTHPHEFKWCIACGSFNHIENEKCHNCLSSDFDAELKDHIEEEMDFQMYAFDLEANEAYYTVR